MSSILNNREAVKVAAENNTTIRDALISLGLRAAGGNYASFKASCKRYDIALPSGPPKPRPRLALQDILVEGSTYTNRTVLKRRCYEEGLLVERCSECGIGPTWNGKELTLHLEHVNGVHDDNRIENLRILCPNCHSQTSTYAGRNSKVRQPAAVRLCDCGVEISRWAKFCPDCRATRIPKTKIDWPDRDELIELVTTHGYSGAGRLLGVSDNAIRKHLNRHPESVTSLR